MQENVGEGFLGRSPGLRKIRYQAPWYEASASESLQEHAARLMLRSGHQKVHQAAPYRILRDFLEGRSGLYGVTRHRWAGAPGHGVPEPPALEAITRCLPTAEVD